MSDFKSKVVYQIYTKSFMDSNGDGLGDINGITEKLDYLKELGIDYIWITPFFQSPMNDNGYDVADYTAIAPEFGTMEDVERLIHEADQRNLGLMFDMVFNHTSTEHKWFQKAISGDPDYMDYYIFKDGAPDQPPTNWESKFGGSAWEYVPHLRKWYLHLFDKTQADLNWENPRVREELKNVVRFWKQKGVKGFRFDVVNLISKPDLFENDDSGDGRRFYTDGPRVHQYLKELTEDTGISDMITVGEMSSTSLENCVRYTNPEEKELSMCFSFHHLKVDYRNGNKWQLMEPDFRLLKKLLMTWQTGMAENNGWNAVFWCNHDQPRAVSRFGDDGKYWKESAKMLAAAVHMLRGTPYIFQGEELGMTNANFTSVEEYRDVESRNYYEILLKQGKTEEEALQVLQARSRDNGRTPMQWNGKKNAGFSVHEPWIGIPKNYFYINTEAEKKDKDSIYYFYKELIKIRKENPVISDGAIEFLWEDRDDVFAYRRYLGDEKMDIYNNLRGDEIILDTGIKTGSEKLLGNYEGILEKNGALVLRPFETLILKN